MKRGFLAMVALALLAAPAAEGRPGDLDSTFGDSGKTYLTLDASLDLDVQADGATVVVGDRLIARVTPRGKLDRGFGKKGYVTKPFNSDSGDPVAAAIQPDGKIVVAGTVSDDTSFEDDIAVGRYLPNGRLDPSFSTDGVSLLSTASGDFGERAEGVALAADGKVLVAGGSGGNGLIARFNADGTPDATFSGDGWLALPFGGTGANLTGIAPGPAGSVYAAGAITTGDDSDMLAVRIDSIGNPDPGFDADGIGTVDFGTPDDLAGELAVLADGNIVLGGATKTRSAFARLTPAGAPDPAFSGDGQVSLKSLSYVAGMAVGSGGTLYAVGGGVEVVRLTAAGALDDAFGGDGEVEISLGGAFVTPGEAVTTVPDGRVMVSGSALLSKDDAIVGLARLRVDAGPPDADADDVLDAEDDCDLQAGDSERAGCPLVKRKLTLTEQKGKFHGNISVSSPGTDLVRVAYRRCLFDGKVTIYLKKRGADKKVGSVGAGSAWTVEEKVRDGDYYARLKPHVYERTQLCGGAKSKVLRG